MRRLLALPLALLLAACGGDDDDGPTEVDDAVASIHVEASTLSMAVGDTIGLTAQALTAAGLIVPSEPVWTTSPSGVLSFVDQDARGNTVAVVGDTPGSATVRASFAGLEDHLTITVTRPAVARVEILNLPPQSTIVVGQAWPLTARTWSASDALLEGRRVDWTSDDTTVARIDLSTGVMTGASAGTARITATSEGVATVATITVNLPPALRALKQVTAGSQHTCAIDSVGAAWCWGDNDRGQLGDGTRDDRLLATRVTGGHTFVAIGAGVQHTCGVTAAGAVLCWGDNTFAQAGAGGSNFRVEPAAIIGLPAAARMVTGGAWHTCALLVTNAAWCWGYNGHGEVGDSTITATAKLPTAVKGGHAFNGISAGATHTCATTNAAVWCWGANEQGMLGDSTITNRPVPVMVRGASWQFPQVAAGEVHNCAFGTDMIARCWGTNAANVHELGVPFFAPGYRTWADTIQHASAVRLVRIGSGPAARHSCGIGTGGQAWCWGRNGDGQLGDGTTTIRIGAVAVQRGSLQLEHVATGAAHTCALTTEGLGYCWGEGSQGRLGGGPLTDQLSPAAVRRAP